MTNDAPLTGPTTLVSAVQRHEHIPQAQRIVVKVGSSSVTGANVGQIDTLVDALAEAHGRGSEVILVSSGAIASAMPFLGLEANIRASGDLATQQAAAAVGQNVLMWRYQTSLDRYGIIAGQLLLTAGDMENPTNRSNARRAFERLLGLRVLPIVNENDTVATQEIRFGDNDRLAALVSVLVRADLLILLSDVDALYTRPPSEPGAARIDHVAHDDELETIAFGDIGDAGVGTGGAATKVAAAKLAAANGIPVLLAETGSVARALSGERLGTWFQAAPHGSAD
ncbi:MAG TPA: glutamate 5-kinase [Microbacteriaceae bacterium]|nr:glutamate 5-kinase [Microbacteriaceae bacterium]